MIENLYMCSLCEDAYELKTDAIDCYNTCKLYAMYDDLLDKNIKEINVRPEMKERVFIVNYSSKDELERIVQRAAKIEGYYIDAQLYKEDYLNSSSKCVVAVDMSVDDYNREGFIEIYHIDHWNRKIQNKIDRMSLFKIDNV